MIIRQAHLRGIASGVITVAFRRWRSPTVKAGGSLRTSVGVLAIDAVDIVDVRDISEEMAVLAGHPSRASLVAELAKRTAGTTYVRPTWRHRWATKRCGSRRRSAGSRSWV